MSNGTLPRVAVVLAAVAAVVLAPLPAAAQDPSDDYCLRADPPPATKPAHRLRFGITPLPAGNIGPTQGEPVPFDHERDVAAVKGLQPEDRELVMRLNRMFWADGAEGVRRYARIVDRYAAAGFSSELQVRYHPPDGAEGDMEAWEEYVRTAARILGERPALDALSITNEANINGSPNTSDGSYDGVREAIVRGMVAARDELDAMGRTDVELGFSFAWRWLPNSDKGFWEEIGELATPEFLAATDYVGVQIYPHLVWPPAPRPNRSAGEEVLEALTLVRHCYLPMAGLQDVDLWISENGYATNLGRTEQSQKSSLTSTVQELHRMSGTLGVTDYRWFNLRDNRSSGTDLFDAVGLLRDDYSKKPAYPTFRALLRRYGTSGPVERDGNHADGGQRPAAAPARRAGTAAAAGAAPAATLPATGGGAWFLASTLVLAGIAARPRRRSRGTRHGDLRRF